MLAKLHGIPLGSVVSVSEIVAQNIPPGASVGVALSAGPPLERGELTFSTTLEIVYAIALPASEPGD